MNSDPEHRSLQPMTAQTARLAFDIETISPDVSARLRPNFDDSRQFKLFTATTAHQEHPGGEIETAVQFREKPRSAADLEAIIRDYALAYIEPPFALADRRPFDHVFQDHGLQLVSVRRSARQPRVHDDD